MNRRGFLKSSTALTGGLVLGFYLPMAGRAFAQAPAKKVYEPNAFLKIDKDGSITVMVKHLEFGQGVATAIPMLLAEELDCDWSKVKYALAPAGAAYVHTAFGIQITGGSSSTSNSWLQMRQVGASARAMLVQAAANQWKVKPEDCKVDKGVITGPGGKKATFGHLADAASKLPVPGDPSLKGRKNFTLIGKPTRRIDAEAKGNGTAKFGMDMKMPGLLTAVVAHPPVFGATVKSYDAEGVKKIPGVTHIVEIANGIAVVGQSFWAAKKGRDALTVEWDFGGTTPTSTEQLSKQFRDLATRPGPIAKKVGDADAITKATGVIIAEYEVPFLAHAPMEPLNCTIDYKGNRAEIWVGSQFQGVDLAAAATAMKLDPANVKLNTMLAGGGFGRRANPASDYIVEAAEIARRLKLPVKVVWTREDDIKGGYYRPMYVHRVQAGFDKQGKLYAWNHVIVGQSILTGTPFESMMVKEGVDSTSVEGVADTPYDIPNLLVTSHSPKTAVPGLWWRSVGNSHTAFVMETMMDELAAASGKDPVEFRRALLAKQPRMLAALNLAAEKSGWGSPLPKGRARGIAVHESFNTTCAHVAEISLVDGTVKVHRVVSALDCGLVVNPLTVEAQIQSAVAFGLSGALYGAITLKDGKVEQSNFHDYPVLRMSEMPKVEVHLVASAMETPTGVGEPGVPAIAPAVANALFVLTGKRARELPLSKTKWG